MATRSTAVTAAIAAGAALVATGITYASAASEPARSAAVVQQAAAPAAALEGNGNNNNGNNNNDNNNNGKGNEGNEHHEHHYRHHRHHLGKIHINERDYPAVVDGCVTIVSGLGSNSLNIVNDSHKTVEVFSGVTCDNGAPIAIVGPWSQSDGVRPRHVHGGVKVKHGVVGSFRVICDRRGGGGYGYGDGDGDGYDRCDYGNDYGHDNDHDHGGKDHDNGRDWD
ncbi:hypothetical protein [Streptomyces sp. Ru72]|uniref:hypothetical protein n=1 Tax=Streptomyces sp. Ru72 TaxID=2080747 RepID=UPI0015E3FDC5|nr:hypothetical protein [Streptomyces sp. Ru72]